MINSLGLLEVSGLAAAIEAADAMLKSAQVRLFSKTITNPALVTLVIEGDLAACRAALDAGAAAASKIGVVIARKEIGRPDADTQWFIRSFYQSMSLDKLSSPETKTNVVQKVVDVSSGGEFSEKALVAFIVSQTQGRNITEIVQHFQATRSEVKKLLNDTISKGFICKRSNRYYSVEVFR